MLFLNNWSTTHLLVLLYTRVTWNRSQITCCVRFFCLFLFDTEILLMHFYMNIPIVQKSVNRSKWYWGKKQEGFLFLLMMLSDGDIFHGSAKWDSKRDDERKKKYFCWQDIDNFFFFFSSLVDRISSIFNKCFKK